jgi:uncharacterized protein (DUF1697 family)
MIGAVTVHIALLRGINVGGQTKVAMSELRDMLASLGFAGVQTLLQSGNAVFRGDGRSGRELEHVLERAAADRLRVQTTIMVRSAAEWAGIIASNPLPDVAARDPSRLVVVALKDAPAGLAVHELSAAVTGPEVLRADGKQLYISYPAGIGRSKLTNTLIEAKLGTRATGRNWNTVLKLGEMARASEGERRGD